MGRLGSVPGVVGAAFSLDPLAEVGLTRTGMSLADCPQAREYAMSSSPILVERTYSKHEGVSLELIRCGLLGLLMVGRRLWRHTNIRSRCKCLNKWNFLVRRKCRLPRNQRRCGSFLDIGLGCSMPRRV